MIKTTVVYDGKQFVLNLPDYPNIELIFKFLRDHLPRTLDFQRHIVQLFDPIIGEFFDLNDEGLKSWLCLSLKDKSQMRLQIIRATLNAEQQQFPSIKDPMFDVFHKIQKDIETLFASIEKLQQTAHGIRNDFQSAFEKYQMNNNPKASNQTIERNKLENQHEQRPVRFPAEDIRFKNSSQTQNSLPTPLVSDVYRDDEDEPNEDSHQPSPIPSVDIEIPLLNVGEDFQSLVSIAVNPSYFFIQNTYYTHDLERLAQSMNEYYSATDLPTRPFRPAEMTCCAARYSVDDRWYRARIKRYNSSETVEIVYLDYGNNEERPVHELRPLDPAFARLPAQAICAALELLPISGDNQSSWTKKASYKFHEDTLSKPLDVRIIAQATLQWPMYFVQLTIDEHTDVAETLISLRLARRASLVEIVRTIGPRLDLTDYVAYNLPKEILQQATKSSNGQRTSNSAKVNVAPTLSSRISRSVTTLPELNFHFNEHVGSCTVTSIVSPSHFFIQFIEKNQFEQLYTEVHETYLQRISCDRVSRLKGNAIHNLGVARNQRDQRFYRVQIINHDRERKTLMVLCVDIGEYLTIPDTTIYELLPEYQNYPAQAMKCSLGLIHSAGDDWSRESINCIHRLIGGSGFKTFRFYSLNASSGTIKTTDPPLPIVLYDINTSTASINEQLVGKKFALPDSNYFDIIGVANEAMSDANGFKNQRIRQYIESQRTYTDPVDKNVKSLEPSSIPDDEENAPYCPPVIDSELRHWYAVEVTHVKTPGEFYIRYPFGIDNTLGQGREPAPYPEEIEPNQMLNDLHRNMADFYSTEQRRGISTAIPYDRGHMVAVRYQSQWYRARVLEFKAATNFAWVQFVDQGEARELGTNTMRPLHAKFLDMPLQAYLCRLDGFDPNYSWSTQDKDLFKKKIRDKILYAKKIREPNVVQLVDLVDGEVVSFESFWQTLHLANQKPSNPNTRIAPLTTVQPPNVTPSVSMSKPKVDSSVHQLQPLLPGLANYASGSEYSQASLMLPKSSIVKRPSGATIPPPPSMGRPPMQFISAGFKQPAEYTHLSPDEQLAQFQQQDGHRIQSTSAHSISKHFRPQH